MRSVISALFAIAFAASMGCTSSSDGDSLAGKCCPITGPACCMGYGGYAGDDGTRCVEDCDGMPRPDDPAWKTVIDDHGCPVLTSEGSAGPRCGSFDGGVDV